MQPRLLPEDQARLDAAALRASKTNTKRGYEGNWGRFAAWCEEQGYQSLPAASNVLSTYLFFLSEKGLALSTIRSYKAAVVDKHMSAGLPHPANNKEVAAAMKDMDTSLGGEQKQAMPLTEAAFAAIRRTAAIPRRRPDGSREKLDDALERGAQDIAIISVMRDAQLRRAEAAALVWSDVRPQPDGTGQVYIRQSKTDQLAKGAIKHLDLQAMIDLERIRPRFHEKSDSVFRLQAVRISERIDAAAQAAGLGDGFTGHSPRVGMTIDLSEDGAGLPDLQEAGRWKSTDMPAKYLRGTQANNNAVARMYARKRAAAAENGLHEPVSRETDLSQFLFNDC